MEGIVLAYTVALKKPVVIKALLLGMDFACAAPPRTLHLRSMTSPGADKGKNPPTVPARKRPPHFHVPSMDHSPFVWLINNG